MSEVSRFVLPSVNIFSSVAIYVQIENEVRFAIASGRLKPGDQLPSVREASETLDVNPNTVAKAYRDLEVMGLLYTRRGMGVYVNKGVQGECRKRCCQETTARLHEVVQEAKAAGISLTGIVGVVRKSASCDGLSPYEEAPRSVMAEANGLV